MSEEPVSLEFLGRQLRRVIERMDEFQDQLTVQTAILLRLETAQNSMAEHLRAMVSQHQRTDRRLASLDERVRSLEEERR